MSDLITQLSDSITTASALCAEIKKTRHIGHSHTQLDLLEASLASGPSLPSTSTPFSSTTSSELESYVAQMGEINARLEHIARPRKHGHSGAGNGHHHQRHEHRGMEDPHFGDLRAAWEAIRDGVEKLLEGKGDVVQELSESVEVKLEIKEDVKEETKSEETKEVETKAEETTDKKEEVTIAEKKEALEVKVSEVEEVKA